MRYELTPHESVEVTDRGPDALVVLATYAPGGSPPPWHQHPDQDEHFEVLAGELTVEVGGPRRVLAAGAEVEVPRGTPHRMWNDDTAVEARVRWATSPPDGTEEWWAALAAARGGRARPRLPRMLALLVAHRGVFRLARAPSGRPADSAAPVR
jgi:quercetin dioxygenase-like cupin family protein